MASTALPFARSREAEAERWLRILRLSGQAGVALQALGVSEAPLEATHHNAHGEPAAEMQPRDEDVVATVSETALQCARERGAHTACTSDVLVAVMQVYREDFDCVLRAHGTDRDEVLERLSADMSSA
jgi:hypothetical protein